MSLTAEKSLATSFGLMSSLRDLSCAWRLGMLKKQSRHVVQAFGYIRTPFPVVDFN